MQKQEENKRDRRHSDHIVFGEQRLVKKATRNTNEYLTEKENSTG